VPLIIAGDYMPQTKPPEAPYYPPRAGKIWVGSRARTAVRAERVGSALASVVRSFLVALVPGLPWWSRGHRKLGLTCLILWTLALGSFLILRNQVPAHPVTLSLPGLRVLQFEPVYLGYGLAAAIHIVSTNDYLRPWLQARFKHRDLTGRLALTIAASVVTAAFVYYTLYAPFID